jgi:hypothetical protein
MNSPITRSPKRVDGHGCAYAGSQLQLQLYVNRRTSELERAIRDALKLPECEFHWRSPIESNGYKEFKDAAFLEELALGELIPELRRFWPASGPRWDGLARITMASTQGVLLVEAKNYPAEVRGGGCKASDANGARTRIRAALDAAAASLGVATSEHWMGSLYQYANRLAHVAFLREHGITAFLVNVCFFNDPVRSRRTSEAAWRKSALNLKKEIGFAKASPVWLTDVFLPAQDRAELLAQEQGHR